MKRHESIVTFSREHHFGLLFCWKIRQGIKKQVPTERIQPYITYFWNHHLKRHFEEEETLLFILLKDNLVEQATAEHQHIRALAEAVVNGEKISPELFLSLASVLDDHIRFEERILFPHLENALPKDKLTALGKELQRLHPAQEKDDYPDEFWV